MINHLRKHTYLLLALALLLQACAGAGVEQQRPEPTTLKVATQPYLAFAPFFIAEGEGYFIEQGLQIEFVQLAPEEVIPAVVTGEVDVSAALATAGLLNAIGRGGKMKVVADLGYIDPAGCSVMALVGSRVLAEAGELDSPDQIKGRLVDVFLASAKHYFLDKLIATVGLTLEDLTLTDIPSPAEADALHKGTLDLATPTEPWRTRLLRAGHRPVLAPIQEVVPDAQFVLVLYSPNLLGEDPDAGKRFMTAYLKAVRQYNQGKTKRNLEILAEHTGLDQALLEEACWMAIRNDGTINVESVLDFQDWALEKGYIDNPVTEDQFWDPSFVEYANQVLGAPSQ
jgi:NitT/TauT family transport system substrate-binding protein